MAWLQDIVLAACPADYTDERVKVTHAYDGDTVTLEDGRRIRLIGINTPELGRDGHRDEPYAIAARDQLRRLLRLHDNTLLLRHDIEKRDRYGRQLSHAYFENGNSVAAELLGAGLATTMIVPPNTWSVQCYLEIEDWARKTGIGLWNTPAFRTHQSANLTHRTRGYRIVRGRIENVTTGRDAIHIDLEGPLVVRINRDDMDIFPNISRELLAGSLVETRGWIKHRRGNLYLQARHPAALRIYPDRAESKPPGHKQTVDPRTR